MKKIYLLFVLLATLFVACKKDKEAEISTFSIQNEKFVPSSTSVELSCEVICATPISKLYLQYSAKSDFSKYDEVQMTKGKSNYSVAVNNLIENTTYYVRYLAENSYSWMKSEKISKFKTQVNSNPDNPEPKQYTITVTSNSSSYGTVSGGGTYEEGAQVTLTATANSGYKFKQWDDGNTENPRVITVTQDATYAAYFEKENNLELGHEYVDLGLPSGLKWATCNIGATRPEEYGDYFAWGETEPKTTYNWSTYKYCKGTKNTLTKYCREGSYGYNGFTDNKTVLDPEDDAASVNWGGNWRMPTDAEMIELREQCTWTWTTQNEVNGYKVVGKNGNFIFLPAAGCMDYSSLYDAGSFGYYWSSSLRMSYPYRAYIVDLVSGHVDGNYRDRYYGLSVRPVYGSNGDNPEPKQYTITVTSNSSSYGTVSGGGTYEEGAQVTLTATAYSGYKFKQWDDGSTENPRVITVTKDESYTAYFEKFEPEYVDLGLPSGLKWATCNVGATKPEEYGDYFAWGEVTIKENYDWTTYKYCKGTENTLTKYCGNSDYGNNGFTDNKTVLDPEDDAATVNWGGDWRMPIDAEMTELREQCTWTWTTQNEVNGYKVVGPNGNFIFLPAASFMNGSVLYSVGTGYYWSSSRNKGNLHNYAYNVGFSSSNVFRSYSGSNRFGGCSVRPVWGERRYTITGYSPNPRYGTVSGGGTYDEGAQVTLTATAYSGYKFKQWDDGSTENPRVITVTQDATYAAYFEKENNLELGHEYVDLGLPSGLKWATCNVGAEKPEEYGDYFAWGETEPKMTYNWDTYKYCNGSSSTLTKYCNNSSYGYNGFTDTKTVLDPEDDAATVNWGGAWRMPTVEEMIELVEQSTWTWTTQNGVNGYKVVGKNGNFIFLPAAGCMYYSSLGGAGSDVCYWSSSLNTVNNPYGACYVDFNSSSGGIWIDGARYLGLSVRPVCQ